jgi:TRAP-type C4-dicarboxylate transport system substrate-binding protein
VIPSRGNCNGKRLGSAFPKSFNPADPSRRDSDGAVGRRIRLDAACPGGGDQLQAWPCRQSLDPAGVALEAFAAEVGRLSNGEMTVHVFHSGQLGSIPEEVKNVISGAQDMHMFSPEIVTNLIDESKVISAPYVFTSAEHLRVFLTSPLYKPGLDKLRALGAIVLDPDFNWLQKDPRGLISTRPIRTPDDLKGLKLRIWESKTAIETWNGLGAQTIVIPRAEMYLAFKQNIIQGGPETIGISVDEKNVEVAKYWTRTDEFFQVNNVLMNKARFDALTPAQQEILHQASLVGGKTYTAQSLRGFSEKRAIAEKQYGVTVIEPDLAPWRAKGREVLATMEADGTVPKGLAEAAMKLQA